MGKLLLFFGLEICLLRFVLFCFRNLLYFPGDRTKKQKVKDGSDSKGYRWPGLLHPRLEIYSQSVLRDLQELQPPAGKRRPSTGLMSSSTLVGGPGSLLCQVRVASTGS
jgi:hypothetical protein